MDYNVPGGTDKEGWQYAADFPVYVTTFCGLKKKKKTIIRRDVTYVSSAGHFMATKP